MQAVRADAACVEGVPDATAGAGPGVVPPGFPSAKRAADARTGWHRILYLAKFGVDFGGRDAHSCHYATRRDNGVRSSSACTDRAGHACPSRWSPPVGPVAQTACAPHGRPRAPKPACRRRHGAPNSATACGAIPGPRDGWRTPVRCAGHRLLPCHANRVRACGRPRAANRGVRRHVAPNRGYRDRQPTPREIPGHADAARGQ